MVTPIVTPIWRAQFFTNADSPVVPCAGGTVQTYLAGTLTPVATYQDGSGTVFNTTTITLDGAGSCNIWLDPALSYKYIWFDANNVQQGVQDNVTAYSSSGGGGGGGSTLPAFQVYQNYQANYGNFPNTLNAGTNYTWPMPGINASAGYTYLPGTEYLYTNIPSTGSVFAWDDTSNGSDTHPLTLPQGLYEITINFQLEGPENFPGNTTDGYFQLDWLQDYTGTKYVYAGPIIQGTMNDAIRFSITFQIYAGSGGGSPSTCGPQFTVRYSNELNLYAFIEITMNITQLQSGTYPGN